MNNKDSKLCPFCGEEIKAIAIKCKHCQSILDEKSKLQYEETGQSSAAEVIVADEGNRTDAVNDRLTKTGTTLTSIGCLLTLFVTIPILLILFFTGC